MYKENNVKIEKEIAGLMLSAIISDSLLFKSPTCTEQDIAAAKELAEIAKRRCGRVRLKHAESGRRLKQKTVEELISLDAKEFTLGSKKSKSPKSTQLILKMSKSGSRN